LHSIDTFMGLVMGTYTTTQVDGSGGNGHSPIRGYGWYVIKAGRIRALRESEAAVYWILGIVAAGQRAAAMCGIRPEKLHFG